MDKDPDSEDISEPSSTIMESSDSANGKHKTETASTGLTQEFLDLEFVESFSAAPEPDVSKIQNNEQGLEAGADVDAEQNSSDWEDVDNGSDFENYPDLEFTTPLSRSPISRDERESKIEVIEIDDDFSDLGGIQEKLGPLPKVQSRPVDRTPFEYHGNIHPLLIPDVLRDIFMHIDSVIDLRNCRLVSTAWNLEACKNLQKRVTITFLDHESLATYMSVFQPCRPHHPHSIFQFYNVNFREADPLLEEFLTEFGPVIKSFIVQQLEVNFDVLYHILRDHLINLQTLWLRVVPLYPIESPLVVEEERRGPSPRLFPQVQQFTIGTRNFSQPAGEEITQRAQKSLTKVLRLLPNLKRITVTPLDGLVFPVICGNVLEAILALGPNGLKYLAKIDFPIEVNEEMLARLTSLGCQHLNNLEMTINSVVKTQTVTDFFHMVGKHTTKLGLSFPASYPYGFQHIRINGQDLRNMRELTLNRFRWNLSFLEHMLNLEKLVLKETDVSSIYRRISMEHKLKILRIEHEVNSNIPPFQAPVFGRITQSFPWLKVLHVPGVNDRCLRSIYFDLPCLTVLELVKGEFTDYGITGVELEVCKDLAETTTYLVVNPDKLRTDLFIGNLTNLKHLKLESTEIGDLSILFGVCKCKLSSLYLKCSNLTDFAMEALADQLGHTLKSLNVLHCPEITEAGNYYFKESLPSPKVLVRFEPNPDADRITERADMSRHHRYCDAFVRRSLDRDGIIGARGRSDRRGGARRYRMFNNHVVANNPEPNVDNIFMGYPPPAGIVEVDDEPIPLPPGNDQMDYQDELADEEIALAAEYMEIIGVPNEGGNNGPPGIHDVL